LDIQIGKSFHRFFGVQGEQVRILERRLFKVVVVQPSVTLMIDKGCLDIVVNESGKVEGGLIIDLRYYAKRET
jgi:citrate lyase gamma subunit